MEKLNHLTQAWRLYRQVLARKIPMEYVGSSFNDSFAVILRYKDYIVFEQTYECINDSIWYEVEGVDFAGGDDTAYQTKWKHASIGLEKYRGEQMCIEFVIYDVGDSAYDSTCLIDNVVVE